jgi:hypothetical protein
VSRSGARPVPEPWYRSVVSEPERETPTEKLRITFALIDIAERMLRQRLRRESPEISEQVLEERVGAWYARRPGAEFGDGVGIPAAWPRR